MNKYELIYRSLAATIGAVTGYLYGGWTSLMGILIAFVVIDYVSGVLAAADLGAQAAILISPSGNKFILAVDDNGNLSTQAYTEGSGV